MGKAPRSNRATSGLSNKPILAAFTVGASLWAAEPCLATTIIDPPGDILSTYVGQVGSDLDILQFTVTMHVNNFYFQMLLGGAPGTTALSRYNIGVDRGAGTNTFPTGFRTGASQDAVVNFVPATLAGEVRLFVGGTVVTTTALPTGAFTTSGNNMFVTVPVSMLSSTGFNFQDYTFLLWSRTQIAGVPTHLGVADFAPDQGLVSLVPEPSTWVIMLMGFAGIGFRMRRSNANERSDPVRLTSKS